MKLLVCLKQILDPELSPRDFSVDRQRLEAVQGSASLVTNIFCENALESALQLRDAGDGEITALTFGAEDAEETLRKALALRVDHACRVTNPGIPHAGSAGVAVVLAAAIEKLGSFDLIMLGREAGDWGEGQTAGLVAERLGMPCVSFVDRVEVLESGCRLHRQTDFGREEVIAAPPLVISITNSDTNLPRIPKTRDIMMAHRKELTTWSLNDVGLDVDSVRRAAETTQVMDLSVPENTQTCELIDGETAEARVRLFAERIAAIVRSL